MKSSNKLRKIVETITERKLKEIKPVNAKRRTALKESNDSIDELRDLSGHRLIELWNEFCDDQRWNDDIIYENDEDFFNGQYTGTNAAWNAALSVANGDWNFRHDYVRLNGYGNVESGNINGAVKDWIDYDALSEWVESENINLSDYQ